MLKKDGMQKKNYICTLKYSPYYPFKQFIIYSDKGAYELYHTILNREK